MNVSSISTGIITRTILVVTLVATLLAGFGAVPANAAGGNGLGPGGVLYSGQSLTSPNGLVRLELRGNGNLVLHLGASNDDAHLLWQSNTGGPQGAYRLVMQATDGNLVIYGPNGYAKAISNARGAGALLAVQSDGNVVVYPGKAGYAPWSTQTHATVAGTCYDTANYEACLSSTQGYRLGGVATSYLGVGHYTCKDFWYGPTSCTDEREGSWWNANAQDPNGGPPGAWEDWANTGFSTFAAPLLKNCVYIRLDISPTTGHVWVSAKADAIPRTMLQTC